MNFFLHIFQVIVLLALLPFLAEGTSLRYKPDVMSQLAGNADDGNVRDVPCPDGTHSCPDGTTCCPASGGGYGCCPRLNVS